MSFKGNLEFNRGYDHGNYSAGYESEMYQPNRYTEAPMTFLVGYLLGFFSSCELHEVPEEYRREVAYWRRKVKV